METSQSIGDHSRAIKHCELRSPVINARQFRTREKPAIRGKNLSDRLRRSKPGSRHSPLRLLPPCRTVDGSRSFPADVAEISGAAYRSRPVARLGLFGFNHGGADSTA